MKPTCTIVQFDPTAHRGVLRIPACEVPFVGWTGLRVGDMIRLTEQTLTKEGETVIVELPEHRDPKEISRDIRKTRDNSRKRHALCRELEAATATLAELYRARHAATDPRSKRRKRHA